MYIVYIVTWSKNIMYDNEFSLYREMTPLYLYLCLGHDVKLICCCPGQDS